MRTLGRLLKITSQRIARNPYHSVGAVFVMFLTFLVGGAFLLVSLGSNAILSYFESRPQIDAFFREDVTEDQRNAFEQKLKDTGTIAEIKYISKEEALEIWKERNKDDPLLIEFVTADILPASFQISTTKIEDLGRVAEIASAEEIVENVVFQEDLVETLTAWTSGIRNAGIVVIVFLLATSLLITLIVISLNISLHKDEIETMRLVGATEGYVRTPFILEGVFYGVAAAVFATILLAILVYWLTPFLKEFLSDIPILPINQLIFLYLLIGQIIAGIIIGAFGSLIATRKYLQV